MVDMIDVMMKLFDTLNESFSNANKSIQKLIEQQSDLINYIKNMPMEELKESLRQHDKDSSDNIDSCTETVETTSEKILKKVNVIEGKISKMILVVLVAFAIITSGYFIIRTVAEHTEKKTITEQTQRIIDEAVRKALDEFRKEHRK